MTWVRVDDGFADSPEMVAAGPVAFALAIWALCYSARHLTDGHIPSGSLLGCSWVADKSQRSRCAGRLEVAGFWARVDDGYRIVNPFAFLQKADDVREKRAANAERQARWRERQQARNASRNGVMPPARNAPPGPTPMTPTVSLGVGDAALRADGAPLAPPEREDSGPFALWDKAAGRLVNAQPVDDFDLECAHCGRPVHDVDELWIFDFITEGAAEVDDVRIWCTDCLGWADS